ncbi:MAG: nucleotide-binding universal stress UspA family protein [Paracoccaceae bacterium]|jgi:nucleotide-binding universal stress UspA family protein
MDIEFDHILLAIDDGATAGIAQQQALDLAQKFKASITVLLIGEDHAAFSDTIKFLGDFTLGKKISLRTIVKQGDFSAAVSAEVQKEEYSIVIVGTSYVKSGRLRKSICYDLATSVKCPLLFVKETNSPSRFASLLLPLSKCAETEQKVRYAASLAQRFNSMVHILLLTKTLRSSDLETVELYGRQAEKYLAERGVKHTVSKSFGVDIAKATESYSRQVKADVVFVMVEDKYSYFLKDRHLKQWIKNGKLSLMTIPVTSEAKKR